MRIVPIIVCTSLLAACFATEELKIGALGDDLPAPHDSGFAPDADPLQQPELDAAMPSSHDADASLAREASAPRAASDDEGDDHDASEHEPLHASDATRDAGAALDAGSDAATSDSSAGDAGVGDADVKDTGSDAATSLLCTFEPWHCL